MYNDEDVSAVQQLNIIKNLCFDRVWKSQTVKNHLGSTNKHVFETTECSVKEASGVTEEFSTKEAKGLEVSSCTQHAISPHPRIGQDMGGGNSVQADRTRSAQCFRTDRQGGTKDDEKSEDRTPPRARLPAVRRLS